MRVTNVGTVVLVAAQEGDSSFEPAESRCIVNRSAIQATPVGSSNPSRASAQISPIDLQLAGSHAFMLTGQGLWIYEIVDPAHPVLRGAFSTLGSSRELGVSGAHVFVSGSHGMEIIDASNPTTPVRVGYFSSAVTVNGLQIAGNTAYLAGPHPGVAIVDVSDRTSPSQIGGYALEGTPQGLRLLGTTAYVAAGASGLRILNVANAAAIEEIGRLDLGRFVGGVEVAGGYAYLATEIGWVIVDVRHPENPVPLGSFSLGGGRLHLGPRWAYSTIGDGLRVADLSDPKSPIVLEVVGPTAGAVVAQFQGDLAYLGVSDVGLEIVRLREFIGQSLTWSVPANGAVVPSGRPLILSATSGSGLPVAFRVVAGPASIRNGALLVTNVGTVHLEAEQDSESVFLPVREVRTVNQVAVHAALEDRWATTSAQSVHVSDGIVYVADLEAGIQILDANQLGSSAGRLGGVDTRGTAFDVQVENRVAYIADGRSGLEIVDVADPVRPALRGRHPTEDFTGGVCVAGDLVVTADGGAGIQVFSRITGNRLGQLDTVGSCKQVRISGSRAYLADDSGFEVVDLSNPALPVSLGRSVDGLPNLLGLDVEGGLAYLAGQTLDILDVSNPAALRRVGRHNVGGVGVAVVDGLAYVATVHDGLHIVDVSAPTAPVLAGAVDTDGYAYDVQVVGDRVYVADGPSGLKVYRITRSTPQELTFDPPQRVAPADSPVPLSATASSGLPVTFQLVSGPATLVGNQLILSGEGIVTVRAQQAGNGPIPAVDVERTIVVARDPQAIAWSAPANQSVLLLDQPYPLEATASSGLPVTFRVVHGPAVLSAGQVTATNAGLILLTAEQPGDDRHVPVSLTRILNKPAAPSVVGRYDTKGAAQDVQVVGNLAFVADGEAGLEILEISNPSGPVRVGGFDTGGIATRVHVAGDLVFLADGDSGLAILDVSNPTDPLLVGTYTSGSPVHSVQVAGRLAYLAVGRQAIRDGGLEIIDISNPRSPVRVGWLSTNDGVARDVHVVDHMAYLAKDVGGLRVVDVTDPATPVLRGAVTSIGTAREVEVVGRIAYLACGVGGLVTVDVSDPAAPSRIGTSSAWSAFELEVVGSLVYVASGNAGVQIYDASDARKLARLDFCRTTGPAGGLHIAGDRAFVAAGDAGIDVVRLESLIKPELSFQLPDTGYLDGVPLDLLAPSNSGLKVKFQVVSGPGTLDGDRLSLIGEGTVVVRAEFAGDRQFLPGIVERSISVFLPLVLVTPRLEPGGFGLSWTGGKGPFLILRRSSLSGIVEGVDSTDQRSITLPVTDSDSFFQILDSP